MALNTGVEAQREPFVLEKSLDLDRFAKDCVVIDVGRDEDGKEVLSYGDNLRQFIYLFNDRDVQELGPIKKLYVTGDWNIGGGEATFDKSGEVSHKLAITIQPLKPYQGGEQMLIQCEDFLDYVPGVGMERRQQGPRPADREGARP